MTFNFQSYVDRYVANARASKPTMNEANGYGVVYEEADVPEGDLFWRVIGIHHLRPEENRGKNNIFLHVVDEEGRRIKDPVPQIHNRWEGMQPNEQPAPTNLDKGDKEPAGNMAVHKEKSTVWALGLPHSDHVKNLHTEHADEPYPASDPEHPGNGNQIGHHSFFIVFQRTRKITLQPVDPPPASEPSTPPPPVTTPPSATFTLSGRVSNQLDNQPVANAFVRLIGHANTVGAVRRGAIVQPTAVTWTRKLTGYEGLRWQCWQKYLAQQVAGITWDEFNVLVLIYNPSLRDTEHRFQADRTYVLPENQHFTADITWDRPLSGFAGNPWECWQEYVENKVIGLNWPTFNALIGEHNPTLVTDEYRFKAEKTYQLPRNDMLEAFELFTASRASGLYKFESVPPGEYRLEVKADNLLAYADTVTVTSDTTLDIELMPVEDAVSFSIGNPFVTKQGQQLSLGGKPFKFVGVNIRGLAHYGDGQTLPHAPADHRSVQLGAAKNMGARVVRLFLASRFANADQLIERLQASIDILNSPDFASADIYLLPAFTNLYNDVPFFLQGQEAAYQPDDLLNRPFFETGYKGAYFETVKKVVQRFRQEPRIFAWEIGNELKLDRGNKHDPNDPNPTIFINFMIAAAAQIRAWDEENHLITTGMISTRHAWLHDDALKRKLYASPQIDFLTVHAYQGENHEDDSQLAQDLDKPFIIEEAGFDAPHGEDRSPKVAADMDKWFGRGASGYMQWGFMATGDNGDGDRLSGMDRVFHSDWDALFDLYRQRAHALNGG